MVGTPNISGWWLLFMVAVYAVPLGVYLHERRWLTRLLAPAVRALRCCPLPVLAASALLFGQMVVRGSTKTNNVNSVEIELIGRTGSVINENLNGDSGETPAESGDEGLSGVVPVRTFDPTQLCFTGINVSTNGIDLQVHCPTNIALPEGALDVYGASALELCDWSLLASFAVADTNCLIPLAWEDIPGYSITNVPSRFFFAVGTRVDSDGDGLADAYEHFVTDTRADNPDTDFDGLSDYEELAFGLNPVNGDDAILDHDGDGIPTLYEVRNANHPNPFVSDFQSAARIVVGGTGVSSLKAAFDASAPYSIVEIAPGVHQGAGWTELWFPPHPVMVTGPTSGNGQRAILRHNGGGLAAFYMDKTTNTHTFVQNLTLDMAQSPSRWLAGFWCGGNVPFAGESVSATFNNVVVRLAASDGANIGWFLRHANSAKVNLAGCVVNARGATCARGIYTVDASPLRIENCSFINFPPDGEKASYGIQLESTPANWGNAASNSPVEIANCLFDDSFTNALPLAFLERGVTYTVDLHHSLMPVVQTNRVLGASMLYTNAMTGVSGLLAPDSPAISVGAPPIVSTVDANGVARGASPDIGAYQYVEFADSGFDSDSDGLTDYDELYVAGTDPTLYDTDGDGLGDADEFLNGSDPLDAQSLLCSLTIGITNGYGFTENLGVDIFGSGPALTNSLLRRFLFYLANYGAALSVSNIVVTNASHLSVVLYNNIGGSGVSGAFSQTTSIHVDRYAIGVQMAIDQRMFDADRDSIPDAWEVGNGMSPTNSLDAREDWDGDGLINLHEYWTGCCPTNSDGQTTLLSVLCRSVDDRLAGKTPSVALPLYNGYPMYGPSLVNHVNTNCWAYGLDFSCASPWNTVYTSRLYPATAISRRHVILAAHLTPTDFQPLYGFRGTNNVFFTRSLVATNYIGNDIVVGLLDSELPAAVNPAKILPADAPDYIKSGRGVPVIALDQYERVYVTDMSALYEFRKDTGVGDVDGVSFSRPNNVTRKAFNKFPLQGGDSGDPCFAVISNNLVLLSHLSLADWFGPSYATLKSQIQAAMDALCTGYSLEEYDLSTYGELP